MIQRLERGRRYGFIDSGGTQYWGTVDATNSAGVLLSGVLFWLDQPGAKMNFYPGDRTHELEWRQIVYIADLRQ